MRLEGGGHLTYCLNVHPGETWEETLLAIRLQLPAVKERCCPDHSFGAGLRLSGLACDQAEGHTAEMKAALEQSDTYAFTVNAFPHGAFHDTRVKETVYLPDWTDPQRMDYTLKVAKILSSVLPDGMEGSISTVPIGYRFGKELDLNLAIKHLLQTVQALHQQYEQTGKRIHLGLEPEPDCLLETTEETVAFLHRLYEADPTELAPTYIGVCMDTCHVALQFEDPAWALRRYREADIRISKIQLSSALEVESADCDPAALKRFDDGVYFHQVTSRTGRRWRDLPDLLAQPDPTAGTLRIHCHVPLDWEGDRLHSTRHTLQPEFWREVGSLPSPHLEVETYTFEVLPEEIQGGKTVAQSMADECLWVLERISDLKEPKS